MESTRTKIKQKQIFQILPEEKKQRASEVNDLLNQKKVLLAQSEEDQECLESIIETLEITNSINQRKIDRLKHRDAIAQRLDATEYKYYAQCCRANFISRKQANNAEAFKNWSELFSWPIELEVRLLEIFAQLIYDFIDLNLRGTIAKYQQLSVQNFLSFLKESSEAFEKVSQETKEIQVNNLKESDQSIK